MLSDKIKSLLIAGIPVLAVIMQMIIAPSCANTTTPPSGGPKDTIPPFLTKISPLPGSINVSRKNTQIVFTFNEYVKVKDPKSIFLSPPQEKAPKYKIKGKSLVISFEEPLDSSTTYTIDITNAICDNNEGNMYEGFTYVFSTGERIDSMVVTGTVRDCSTLKPIKGATVLLYKDHADSAVFLHRPDAAIKTDEWGFFCIRNIQDTTYRLYALKDANNNNKYDPETEMIAFEDSLVKPVLVVSDTLKELAKYDMKDTAHVMARVSEYELNIFKETPSKQMIVNKERVGDRTAYITFMAPYAQIDTMWIKGIRPSKLITQFNIVKDSLEIWVNDQRKMPDTLKMYVNYHKTDTLGNLTPFLEEVKLVRPKANNAQKSSKKDIKKEDTTCVFTIEASAEKVEQYGFVAEFKYPVVEEAFDSLEFWSLNPKQQRSEEKYVVERDSLNLRKYTIWPSGKLQQGFEYHLKFPHRRFKDINGFLNDSTEVKVTLPNDDKLSSLSFELSGVNNRYIIDLLNEKRDKVLRSYIVDNDQTIVFPYLKAGKYSVRITEDLNRNGVVDTGNLLEHKQPEKVKFYTSTKGDSYVIDVMEMTDIVQALDLSVMFE